MKALAMVTLAVALSGCWSTTVRSGKPIGEAPMAADGKWHSGWLSGTQEASGPYNLTEICPNGWAEITTKTSFAQGLVQLVTQHIYNPQTVTVKCAAKT